MGDLFQVRHGLARTPQDIPAAMDMENSRPLLLAVGCVDDVNNNIRTARRSGDGLSLHVSRKTLRRLLRNHLANRFQARCIHVRITVLGYFGIERLEQLWGDQGSGINVRWPKSAA